jgi:hypothetical protein
MKPFLDVELMNDCIGTVVNTKTCNFSNFKEIDDLVSNLQLLLQTPQMFVGFNILEIK